MGQKTISKASDPGVAAETAEAVAAADKIAEERAGRAKAVDGDSLKRAKETFGDLTENVIANARRAGGLTGDALAEITKRVVDEAPPIIRPAVKAFIKEHVATFAKTSDAGALREAARSAQVEAAGILEPEPVTDERSVGEIVDAISR